MMYEGDFVLSEAGEEERRVKHGKGIMRWPDGKQYEGDFKFDNMDGEGSMSWPDGAMYVGQYRNNLKEGIGKLTFPDGSRFEGNFYRGQRHGEMLYVKPDGNAFHMEFKQDKVVSKTGIPSFQGWTLKSGYDIFIKDADSVEAAHDSETMCSICLGDLCHGDTCCTTPCQHVFHKDCLDTWVRQRNHCPLCVQKIPLHKVYEV